MAILKISDTASVHLDRWLDQVMRGELQLWQLPASVTALYFAGWAERDLLAKTEAREYEHRLDVMYMQAFTPKERQAEYQRRLDEHFELVAAAFFAGDAWAGEGRGGVRLCASKQAA